MRSLWLLVISVPMAGCTSLAERQAQSATLVGQPVTELVTKMGDPAQTQDAGGTTVLTYEDKRLSTVPGAPFCFGPGMWCDGTGFPPPPPVMLVCRTTFMVNAGIVSGYHVDGSGC